MKLKSLIRKSLAKVPTDLSGQERRFAESVSENLDVLTGRRGNLIDRAVTFRDLLDTGVMRKTSGLVTDTGTIDVVAGGDPNDPDGGVVDIPTQPTNLTATGGFGRINLSWSLPPYRGHSRIQIFRHTSDSLSAAQAAGVYQEYFGDAHFWYDIGLPSSTTYYYWVRSVNRLGATSAFNSSTGTSATTAVDYLYISGLIDDILDDDVNSLGLNTALADASGTTDLTQIQQDISDIEQDIADLNSINAWSSSASYSTNDMVTYSGKIWKASQSSTNQTPATGSSYWTEVGNYTNLVDFVSATQEQNVSTLSTLSTNYYTTSGTDSAIAAATTNLASQSYVQTELADYTTTASLTQNYYTKTGADAAISAATTNLASQTYVQTELGDYTTTADLTQNYYTKTAADSAISTGISTYTTTVGSETLTLQQHHSSINGIQGKYSIKIDDNGSVAGFGLISTSNTGVPSTGTGSAFIVAADRFAITSDADSTATENSNVGDNYPFKVFTTTHNVTDADGNQAYDDNGNAITVPAGVYIKDAFIHNGQITAATIEKGTITDAEIGSLNAGKITSGQIQIDNQNNFAVFQGKSQVISGETVGNYNSNASGFFLGNVNGYGAFHIGAGSARYLKFNSSNGDLIATGLEIRAADGTVLVDAGGMTGSSGGNLVYNANFSRGDLTFNSATSTWTEDTQDVDGFTIYNGTGLERKDLGYIRAGDGSTGQGYVRSNKQRFPVVAGETLYLYAQTSTLAGLWMAVAYYDNSDGTTTSGYVSQTAVSNSNSDFDSKSITAGGNSRKSSIAAITVPASAQYGEIRFGSNTGNYVYYFNVGVSRTPPEIAPKYAATYIRDLSVDTLQIAGNAVTVPIGVDDINVGDWVAYSGVSTDTGVGTNWGLAAHTGSAGGQTAVPLSWDDADKAPTAINLIGCINVLGQSGSAHTTVRVRLVRSTSPTFSSDVTQVQQVGGSQRTDFSATYSLNTTIDVSSANLQPNTNYYFGLQVHANDQVNSTAPYKIGANGLTVLAAKK